MSFLLEFTLFEVFIEAPPRSHVINFKVHIDKCQVTFYCEPDIKRTLESQV
jgi:hypothetical protein